MDIMFKSKEELMKQHNNLVGQNIAYERGVNDSFKNFDERVEFCKKYRYSYSKLIREQPNVFEKYRQWVKDNVVKDLETGKLDERIPLLCDNNLYQDWLFDYCFGGVK